MMRPTFRTMALVLAIFVPAVAAAAPITPTFTTFGSLPMATFGGSGIPNDAVAFTQVIDGLNLITIGLTVTERYSNAPVTNDGAGTFFAGTGANTGDPADPTNPAHSMGPTWNLGWYIDVASPGDVTALPYYARLTFDPLPGVATDASAYSTAFDVAATDGNTPAQDSWNLMMGFLGGATFNPFANGQYGAQLSLNRGPNGANPVATTAILVNVGDVRTQPVPEPASMLLMGMGSIGAIAARRRKARLTLA